MQKGSAGGAHVIARNLSCPEGLALDGEGQNVYVVENPVGNECEQPVRKDSAQLTRINIQSGSQTRIALLRSSRNGEEGGPHGLAIQGDSAYVCECPEGDASLTKVNLHNGNKTQVVALRSPSGCAVGGSHAFVVEQGEDDGSLVMVDLKTHVKSTLLSNLEGPMGVAVDEENDFVYVAPRHKNEVIRFNLLSGEKHIIAESDKRPFNSPIGLSTIPSARV